MNIVKAERDAKVKAIAEHLKLVCHENGPFKAEFSGIYWNYETWAEAILKLCDEVEIEFEEKYFAAREAEHDEKTPF